MITVIGKRLGDAVPKFAAAAGLSYFLTVTRRRLVLLRVRAAVCLARCTMPRAVGCRLRCSCSCVRCARAGMEVEELLTAPPPLKVKSTRTARSAVFFRACVLRRAASF